MSMRWNWVKIIAVVALLVGAGVFVYLRWFDSYRYAVVTPGVLYRDGMRSTWELETTLRKVKPKTVVSLVTDAEVGNPAKGDFQGEAKLLAERGIELVRLPVALGGPPTPADIEKFLSIVDDPSRRPVLVHCAQGVVRTGMMVAAYQKRELGYTQDQALAAINIFGKGIQRAERVRRFIESDYGGDWAGWPASTAE